MLPENLRFANIVGGLTVDHAAYQHQLAHSSRPRKKYVILFTARSGSSWLTTVLAGTRLLGTAEEYINPDFVRDVSRSVNAKEPQAFMELLQRREKTPNGVFGMETRFVDIALFGEEHFFRAFGNGTVYFNLWRENIVAQAISLYRAVSSGRFHSTDLVVQKNPVYDAQEISNWMLDLQLHENRNIEFLRGHGIAFSNLRYETMVKNRAATVQHFFDRLGITDQVQSPVTPAGDGELQKIGDEWNEEIERRFRAEHAAAIAALEDKRLVRHLRPQDIAA